MNSDLRIAWVALTVLILGYAVLARGVSPGGVQSTAGFRHSRPSASDEFALRSKVNVESWDDGGAVSHFVYLHPSEVFPAAVIKRAGQVSELKEAPRPEIGAFVINEDGGSRLTLQQLIQREPIDGFIILHRGAVVYETYPRMRCGMKPRGS